MTWWYTMSRFMVGVAGVLLLGLGTVLAEEAKKDAKAGRTAGPPEPWPVAANVLEAPKAKLFFISSRYFVRNWALLGPFYFDPGAFSGDNVGKVIDNELVPGEATLDPVEGTEVKDGRKWLLYTALDTTPEVIDLDAFYGEPDYAVAYAVANIYADADIKDAMLLCGSDDFVRIWVNGKAVHTYNEKRRGTEPDCDKIPNIALNKGWNKIVVKCVDLVSGWSFVLRFAPPADASGAIGAYRVNSKTPKPKFTYEPIAPPAPPKPGKIADAIDLAGEWEVKADKDGVSVNEKWEAVGAKVEGWKKVKVPGAFDEVIDLFEMGKLVPPYETVQMTEQGLYNGVAWLQKMVNVPEKWKGDYRYFLELGRVDDFDVTYINGHNVGHTDNVTNPNDFWQVPRAYEVSTEMIEFGKPNKLSVMVVDSNGEGGIFGPEVKFVCREKKGE